jgi:predicted transcriptional regulator of viral defense system
VRQRIEIIDFIDRVDLDIPSREALVTSFTSGYSLLYRTKPETGSTDSTYRLRMNIESTRLQTEVS